MQVFIMRHGDAALDAASDSVRPLTTNGCDESRLMANWLKGQKVEIERVLVSPFPASRANTGRSRGLSEPAFQCRSSAGVNALRRCWSGQCLFTGVDQWRCCFGTGDLPLTLSRVSGCWVMSGRNAAYVYHLGHCQRNAWWKRKRHIQLADEPV